MRAVGPAKRIWISIHPVLKCMQLCHTAQPCLAGQETWVFSVVDKVKLKCLFPPPARDWAVKREATDWWAHLSALSTYQRVFFVSTYTATQIIGSLKLLLPLTDWTLLYRGLGKRRYPITFRSACLPPTPICCHLSGGGAPGFDRYLIPLQLEFASANSLRSSAPLLLPSHAQ